MKKFSTTELRTKTTNIYNEVMEEGVALITNTHRPDMYILSQKYMDAAMTKKFEEGKRSVK
jgi:hypothetical protein